jgi:hypothetical protein
MNDKKTCNSSKSHKVGFPLKHSFAAQNEPEIHTVSHELDTWSFSEMIKVAETRADIAFIQPHFFKRERRKFTS